ncbi:MAG TPA: YihY/virulence factor BrkB family protein, partial [Steroidobacteraceae bacterium]
LVSLVPLLLLLVAALGLILRVSDLAAAAEAELLEMVETSFGAELRQTLAQLLLNLQQGSVIAVIVSLVAILLTGSKVFHHLRMTFRAIWKYDPPLVSGSMRHVLRIKAFESALSFLMLLSSSMLLLLGLLAIAAIHWLYARFGNIPLVSDPLAWLVAVAVPVIFAPLTFALLLRYLPPVRLHWRHVWLASVLCAGSWVLGAEIFALYSAYWGQKFGAYGAIGGVLLVMLWMNLMSQTLFFGAELCKVSAARQSR